MRSHARLLAAALVAASLPVLGPAGQASAAEPVEVRADWGRTAAPDGVLKRGCKRYAYRYRLTVPTDDWEVEVKIKDPKGHKIASTYLLSDSEEPAGRLRFRLCGVASSPGRFTIKAKVSVWDGWDEEEGRLPNSHFRLRRP